MSQDQPLTRHPSVVLTTLAQIWEGRGMGGQSSTLLYLHNQHRPSLQHADSSTILLRCTTFTPCEERKAEEVGGDLTNGGVGRVTYFDSPRSSTSSNAANSPFQVMARNSLSSLHQRRQSSNSAYIREPIHASTDDRNWSWLYLRERFRLKDLEHLFDRYLLRLHHAMLIVYLFLQLLLCLMFIVGLLCSGEGVWTLLPEYLAYAAIMVVCVVVLVCLYSEATFRQHPGFHILISGVLVLALFATEVALTIYFHHEPFPGDEYMDMKFGNSVYLLLVVYMFLPVPRKWHVSLMAALITVGDFALTWYAIEASGRHYITTKLGVECAIMLCVNLVGLYWRFMSEVAFRRAFLDKRGNLESKFKLDAQKRQEESLLLSVLPKNIMLQVKSDFRNLIEQSYYKQNPISKNNPFPNLYLNRHPMVSILYADIVNFTPLTTQLRVDQLVEMLNDLFGKFDEAAETNNCLRIKLLGDCYYCVSGVPEYKEDHANNCVKVGFEMIEIIREVRAERKVDVDMRIGIHSGSVLSGLIGVRKWQFDVWSNDVTIANHMEQMGEAGRVHVTHKTRELLSKYDYGFEPSGAREKDPLLQSEQIDTFLIIPRKRKHKRRVHYSQPASIKPRVSIATTAADLGNLYEGDASNLVQYSQSASKAAIYNRRRRSTLSESNSLASKRRTVVMDKSIAIIQGVMVDSNEFMEKAIEAMPLRKYDQWFRPEGINPVLLTFKQQTSTWELLLLKQPDPLYKYYIMCALIIWVAIFTTQQALMPQNQWGWMCGVACLVVLVVVMPLAWVATIIQLIIDPHNDLEYESYPHSAFANYFNAASKFIISSFSARVIIYLVICAALYCSSVVNVMECKELLEAASIVSTTDPLPLTTTEAANLSSLSPVPPTDLPPLCCDPWYFTYSVTLTLLVAWAFFRVHFLLKFSVYVLAVTLYGFLVLDFAEVMYSHEQVTEACPPLTVTSLGMSSGLGHLFYLITVLLALHMMDRQMEYIMRLDFQWKQQLEEEQKEAETTQFANKLLLQNILPQHVAEMYLSRGAAPDELYHESYNHACVIFASIPNYSQFYRDNVNFDEGQMCLKVLNEIITDFDMLTFDAPYRQVEKIKVVGSTYMAACGLQPGRRSSDESGFEEHDKRENVATITKFAAEMFEKLKNTNAEGMQEFELRIGIDVGPVIAGVVGAHKPMYDIWGNTVNVASRMDYTGKMGKIHVTSEVGEILKEFGWEVECRGEIFVKGKGTMTTYFVDPANVPYGQPTSPAPHVKHNTSHVVHEALGERRKSSHDKLAERRKSTQDMINNRRRSSQLSRTSIKNFLSSHRGSLDITRVDSDGHSIKSDPFHRLSKSTSGGESNEEVRLSSFESLDSELSRTQGKYTNLPSPLMEEQEWTLNDTPSFSNSSIQTSCDSLHNFIPENENIPETMKHVKAGTSQSPIHGRKSTPDINLKLPQRNYKSHKPEESSRRKSTGSSREGEVVPLCSRSCHSSITIDCEDVQDVQL